jgi:hypothetical protein
MAQLVAYTLVTSLILVPWNYMHAANANPAYNIGGPIGIPIGVFLVMYIGWLLFALIVHGTTRMFGGSAGYSGTFRAVALAAAPCPIFIVISMLMGAGTVAPRYGAAYAPPTHVMAVQYQRPGGGPVGRPSFGGAGVGGPNGGAPFGGPSQFGQRPTAGDPAAAMEALARAAPMFLIGGIVLVWCLTLLGIGVAHIHQLSSGAAAGVTLLSLLFSGIILFGISFLLGMVMVGALSSMH